MNITSDQLTDLSGRIFEAAGCASTEARRVATRLVESNLVGHDSHGVLRIPSYVEWLRNGKVLANRSIRVLFENDAIAVVDGEFGLGQTVGEQAIRLGIDKSARHGVSVIALRNTGHLGRIGDWAEMAAAEGRISLHFVNTSGAGLLVAPFGGIERRLSANPIAIGVPTDADGPLILDMSACTIAEGKIRVALNQGAQVPDGCLIDAEGRPLNDPRIFYGDPPGSILPISGHKGYALSFMIEMLAGALTGGSCSNPNNAARVANGMLSIVIDRGMFDRDDAFFAEVQRYVAFVKSARTVSPDGEILVPGEKERRTRSQRVRGGIPLDETTWRQICETCRILNVTHEFPVPAEGDPSGDAAAPTMPACEPTGPEGRAGRKRS